MHHCPQQCRTTALCEDGTKEVYGTKGCHSEPADLSRCRGSVMTLSNAQDDTNDELVQCISFITTTTQPAQWSKNVTLT